MLCPGYCHKGPRSSQRTPDSPFPITSAKQKHRRGSELATPSRQGQFPEESKVSWSCSGCTQGCQGPQLCLRRRECSSVLLPLSTRLTQLCSGGRVTELPPSYPGTTRMRGALPWWRRVLKATAQVDGSRLAFHGRLKAELQRSRREEARLSRRLRLQRDSLERAGSALLGEARKHDGRGGARPSVEQEPRSKPVDRVFFTPYAARRGILEVTGEIVWFDLCSIAACGSWWHASELAPDSRVKVHAVGPGAREVRAHRRAVQRPGHEGRSRGAAAL